MMQLIIECLSGLLLSLYGLVLLKGNFVNIHSNETAPSASCRARRIAHLAPSSFEVLSARPSFVAFQHRGRYLHSKPV